MKLEEQLKQMRDSVMEKMPASAIKIMTDGFEEIRNSQLKENALQINDIVPNVTLFDPNGDSYVLNELITQDFLILNFYRGGWCPYCNMELRAYEALRNDFKTIGADIVGVSAEVQELGKQTHNKNALTFPVLTDKDAEFMKAIGIVFELNEETKQLYKNFGMDFTKIHGNDNFELPIPAIYVINKNREIIFKHIEEDYTTRLEPKDLLNSLRSVSSISTYTK